MYVLKNFWVPADLIQYTCFKELIIQWIMPNPKSKYADHSQKLDCAEMTCPKLYNFIVWMRTCLQWLLSGPFLVLRKGYIGRANWMRFLKSSSENKHDMSPFPCHYTTTVFTPDIQSPPTTLIHPTPPLPPPPAGNCTSIGSTGYFGL